MDFDRAMMSAELKKVVMYVDGAAEPNPGPGGWGVVLISGGHRKELSGGVRRSTNNRMEILAAIKGLQALKMLCDVTLYSDSRYVVDAMTGGAVQKWEAKEWWKNTREKVPNWDLWEELLHLCTTHRVKFNWVKGHAGVVENERCDVLAMAVVMGELEELPVDEGYEANAVGAGEEDVRDVVPRVRGSSARVEIGKGLPCRKCGAVLERRAPKKRGRGEYYYAYYFHCPGCGTNYMVEEAKRRE